VFSPACAERLNAEVCDRLCDRMPWNAVWHGLWGAQCDYQSHPQAGRESWMTTNPESAPRASTGRLPAKPFLSGNELAKTHGVFAADVSEIARTVAGELFLPMWSRRTR